jgi:hypothetical protein
MTRPGSSIPVSASRNRANSTLINYGTISTSGSIVGGVVFGGDGGSITNSGQISGAYGHAIEIATGSGETTVVRNLQVGVIQSGDAAVLGDIARQSQTGIMRLPELLAIKD